MTPPILRLWVGGADFDPGAEIAALSKHHGQIGAVASFIGLVRGEDDTVSAMTLEHYPGMTEKQIRGIVDEAASRWRLDGITILHRIGRLLPGDRIVFVGVASQHRGDAFAACEFLMDWLKTRAPFWKREEGAGGERWVAAREIDDERARAWQKPDDNR